MVYIKHADIVTIVYFKYVPLKKRQLLVESIRSQRPGELQWINK